MNREQGKKHMELVTRMENEMNQLIKNIGKRQYGQALSKAAKSGDIDAVQKLLKEFDPLETGEARMNALADYCNHADQNGSSPLFHAVWPGFDNIVHLLVQSGANVNAINNRRNTAMHFACNRQHYSIINYLLQNGADIRLKNSRGMRCWQEREDTKEAVDMASYLKKVYEELMTSAGEKIIPMEEGDDNSNKKIQDDFNAATNQSFSSLPIRIRALLWRLCLRSINKWLIAHVARLALRKRLKMKLVSAIRFGLIAAMKKEKQSKQEQPSNNNPPSATPSIPPPPSVDHVNNGQPK